MATGGPAGTGGSGGAYDPRYDPAFQRGFDGSAGQAGGDAARPPARPAAETAGRAGPPGAAASSSPIGSVGSVGPAGTGRAGFAGSTAGAVPIPRAGSGGVTDRHGRSVDPAAQPAAGEFSWFSEAGSEVADVPSATSRSDAGDADAAVDERAAASRAHAHRMWTAYTVCLSALSAACMAFGVVLVTRAYGVFNSTTVDSRDDIYWAQLGGQFGPWVFVVGLATGIGVIFLHAAQWRPPHD